VLSSFLNPIVKLEMGLHSFQLQILSSIFYLGILFGSLVSGKLADFYGRRPVILAGSFVHFIVCCLFLFISNFVQVVIVRFLYGFTHGLTIVLTTAMFS
jgi:MFS family permease